MASARSLLAVVCALVAVLAAGSAPASADTTNVRDPMTDEVAASYYLQTVCEYNDAQAKYADLVYGPDNRISFTEARRRLPQLKRATAVWARANYRWSRDLLNAPGDWPLSVANPIDQTAGKLLRMHTMWRSAAAAPTALRWWNVDERAADLSRTLPTATIRARLDLPAPGRGC